MVDSLFHLTLDGLRKYNIVKDKELADFYDKIHEKNDPIPIENRDDSKAGLALKAMEDSRYQLNEETMRELFANLISSTLDNRKNGRVVPVFSHILANMTKEDALFLKALKESTAIPLAQIVQYESLGTSIPLYENIVLFENRFDTTLTQTLDSLSMFGIINIEPDGKLASTEHQEIYSAFKASDYYIELSDEPAKEISGITFDKVTMIEGGVFLTSLGFDFVNIVFQD